MKPYQQHLRLLTVFLLHWQSSELMRIRIRWFPDPAYHFDADPYADPNPDFFYAYPNPDFYLMRIRMRIQVAKIMWIRIHNTGRRILIWNPRLLQCLHWQSELITRLHYITWGVPGAVTWWTDGRWWRGACRPTRSSSALSTPGFRGAQPRTSNLHKWTQDKNG
jgi:hypothetical protein